MREAVSRFSFFQAIARTYTTVTHIATRMGHITHAEKFSMQ